MTLRDTGYGPRTEPERQTIPCDSGGAIHLDLPSNDTYGHFDLSIVAPQGVSAAVYLTREEVACLRSLLADVLADVDG